MLPELEKGLDEYFSFCNHERLHQNLSYRPLGGGAFCGLFLPDSGLEVSPICPCRGLDKGVKYNPTVGQPMEGNRGMLSVVKEGAVTLIEGATNGPPMLNIGDIDRIVEACLSAGIDNGLLYPNNLTDAFFDLSSGQAGVAPQKMKPSIG